jgi:tripartite-type tricarboxylate transporter receptor subunit TctC
MKVPHRRRFLHLAAGAATLPAISRIARAQAYPSRPVRIIVGFAPGGAPDIVARLLGPTLSERLGQPIFVENRTGAGSNIATEAVVNSPPDGHTLLLVSPPNFVNASLYEKLNYDFIRDIAPVVALIRVPNVMVVTPSLPVKTVSEFIAYAKANPDKLNMASGGNGTSIHMAGELFKMMTGVRMAHVPYRGVGASYPDLLAGQVQVMFDSTPGSIEFIRSGRLRALGLAALARSRHCRMCRLLPMLCLVSNRAHSTASACLAKRRQKSLSGSTRKLTRSSPSRPSRRGCLTWPRRSLAACPRISVNSPSKKRRNGPGWSVLQASRRTDRRS